MGDADVVIVRYEVVNVLFKVRTRAANRVHFVLANHLGEREAELRRAHRAGESDKHLPAARQMRVVRFGGIHHYRRIEMAVMVFDEIGNGTVRLFFCDWLLCDCLHESSLGWAFTSGRRGTERCCKDGRS